MLHIKTRDLKLAVCGMKCYRLVKERGVRSERKGWTELFRNFTIERADDRERDTGSQLGVSGCHETQRIKIPQQEPGDLLVGRAYTPFAFYHPIILQICGRLQFIVKMTLYPPY